MEDERLSSRVLSGANGFGSSGGRPLSVSLAPLSAAEEDAEARRPPADGDRLLAGFVSAGDGCGPAVCWTVYCRSVLRLHDTSSRRALAQWSFADAFFRFAADASSSSSSSSSAAVVTAVAGVADATCTHSSRYLAVLLESQDAQRTQLAKIVIVDVAKLRVCRVVVFPKPSAHRLTISATQILLAGPSDDAPAKRPRAAAVLLCLSSPRDAHFVWLRAALTARSSARLLYPVLSAAAATDDDINNTIDVDSDGRQSVDAGAVTRVAVEAGHEHSFSSFHMADDIFCHVSTGGAGVDCAAYVARRRGSSCPLLLVGQKTQLLAYSVGRQGSLRAMHVDGFTPAQLCSSKQASQPVDVLGLVPVSSAYRREHDFLWVVWRRSHDHSYSALLLALAPADGDGDSDRRLQLSWSSSRIHVHRRPSSTSSSSSSSMFESRNDVDRPLQLVGCRAVSSSFLWLAFSNGGTWISYYPDAYSLSAPDSPAALVLPPFHQHAGLVASYADAALLIDRSFSVVATGRRGAQLRPTQAQLELVFVSGDRVLHRQSVGTDGVGVATEQQARQTIARAAASSSSLSDFFELLDDLLAAGRVSTIFGCLFYPPPYPDAIVWEPLILKWSQHAFARVKDALWQHYKAVFSDRRDDGLAVALSDHFGRLAHLHSVLQALSNRDTSEEGARNLSEQLDRLLRESQLLEIVIWLVDNRLAARLGGVFDKSQTDNRYLQHLFGDCGLDAALARPMTAKQLLHDCIYQVEHVRVDAKRALVLYALQAQRSDRRRHGVDSYGLPLLSNDDNDGEAADNFAASFLIGKPTQRYVRALWAMDHGAADDAFAQLQALTPLAGGLLFAALDYFNSRGDYAAALALWRQHSFSGLDGEPAHARCLLDTLLGNGLLVEALHARRLLVDLLPRPDDARQLFDYFVRRAAACSHQFQLLSLPFDEQEEAWLLAPDVARQLPNVVPVYHLLRGDAHVALTSTPASSDLDDTVSQALQALRTLVPTGSESVDAPVRFTQQQQQAWDLSPPRDRFSFSAPLHNDNDDDDDDVNNNNDDDDNINDHDDDDGNTLFAGLSGVGASPKTPNRKAPAHHHHHVLSSTPLLARAAAGDAAAATLADDLSQTPAHHFSPIRLRSGKSFARTPLGRTPRRSSRLVASQLYDSEPVATPRESPAPTSRLRTGSKPKPKIAQLRS